MAIFIYPSSVFSTTGSLFGCRFDLEAATRGKRFQEIICDDLSYGLIANLSQKKKLSRSPPQSASTEKLQAPMYLQTV